MLTRLRHRLPNGDSGASLVTVVLFLPVLILIAAFAVDTANWFVHKRHLQTQADSGVLAAAREFQFPCGTPITGTPDAQIIATAHTYDGTGASGYNAQVGNPPPTASSTYGAAFNNVISLVNSATYINNPDNASGTDDTDLAFNSPCKDGAIDLKLTETNTPLFFKFANVYAKYINAQARVTLKGQTEGVGSPIGVPTSTPNTVAATFIDEATGLAITPPGTVTLSTIDNVTWTSASTPVTFPQSLSGRIGVRIALGGETSTACGDPSVTCYDLGSANGAGFIRGWSADDNPGQPTPPSTTPVGPRLRTAVVTPITCASGSFSASSASCTVRVDATPDFDAGLSCTGATPNVAMTLKATGGVTASSAMTCTSGTDSSWSSGAITIPTNSGPTGYAIDWVQTAGKVNGITCKTGGSNPAQCSGTFTNVQRMFAGAANLSDADISRSGPISALSVTEAGAPFTSVQQCSTTTGFLFGACTHNLVVTVGVYGLQNTTSISSAPVTLRVTGSQGNHALDCGQGNGSSDFDQSLAVGCGPHGTTTLPAAAACVVAQSPPVCVGVNPGNGKKVTAGMQARINCGGVTAGCSNTACNSRNFWTSPNTIPGILAAAPQDPRIVQMFVVPFGTFTGVTGSGLDIPIRSFASFYVTGFDGSPCKTAGTTAGRSYVADDAANNGEIVGHFVKYVTPGGVGSGTCKPTTVGDCVAVLTK